MSTKLIEAVALKKSYGGLQVLNGVDLSVNVGEKLCILGPSGSGKTTLLRSLNILTEPDAGQLYFRGTEVVTWPAKQRGRAYERTLRQHRMRLAMVFQQFELFPHLSVLDNVLLGPVRVLGVPRKDATDKAMALLDYVKLATHARKHPTQLSGGEQQRVAIARALAMEPQAILFDEPTSALDPEMAHDVVTLMRQLASDGQTMLTVTHDVAVAAEIADRIIVMDKGQIIETGPPSSVLAKPTNPRTQEILRIREHV